MPKAEKIKVGQKLKPIHPLSRKAQFLSKQSAREPPPDLFHKYLFLKIRFFF
jgi:hypothetical protein